MVSWKCFHDHLKRCAVVYGCQEYNVKRLNHLTSCMKVTECHEHVKDVYLGEDEVIMDCVHYRRRGFFSFLFFDTFPLKMSLILSHCIYSLVFKFFFLGFS